MRLSLLYIIGFFISFPIRGQAQFIAHCTIYNEDNQPMTVYLDGEKKNDVPSSRVRVINLTEQAYKLKIVFADTTIEPIVKYRFELQDSRGYPADRTFIVKKNRKGYYNIHWKSETAWPGYIKPVNVPLVQQNNSNPTHIQLKKCLQITLTDSSFATALSSLNSISSEEIKVLSAKQIIQTNCVSSEQVRALLGLFSNEEIKVEVAKIAYGSTVDKGNYFILNSAFKDERYLEMLNIYILDNYK